MRIICFAILLMFILTGCGIGGDDSNVGGPLPMLPINWTTHPDGDVLFWAGTELDNTLEIGEILARIGDDQPIPFAVALAMLEAVGLHFDADFEPETMMTLWQTNEIMRRFHPTGYGIYVLDEDSLVSFALWVDLFLSLLEEIEHKVEVVNIVPLNFGDGHIVTNLGMFSNIGINLTAFIDQEIRVLHHDREILAILGLTSFTPLIQNAMILHSDAFGATVFSGGATRNFVYAEGIEPLPDDVEIASLRIDGHEIIEVFPSESIIQGTILRITDNILELREWGSLPLCINFAVYKGAEVGSTQDLIVGSNIAYFHIIDGRIGAAVVYHGVIPTYIRVVIGTSGFTGLVHDSLKISSDGMFAVSNGSDMVEIFEAGDYFTVSETENTDLWGSTRLYISTIDPSRKLEIVGLSRNWPDGQSPRYRGVFEITHYNGGGFIIVNELPLEEYLYAVVPSEMPSSFGVEASKIQAITARSFAYHQFYVNQFRAFGAHVDDSVISQVYNNIPENEISIAAVNATRGQVLVFEGALVRANYFSTSGGTTANFGDVWASGGQFPSDTPMYLRAATQFYMRDHNPGDLRQESYAAAFFRNNDIPGFDKEFPWFRWHVTMTAAEISARVNANLAARQTANPVLIDATGSNIGHVTDIEVIRRGQGGNIMEILFIGTDGTARVQTEFNIRTLLAPGSVPVIRHDSSSVVNLQLLPSAFFTMEKEYDADSVLTAITFFGGGNGHGVGMSQNGAFALLNRGLGYLEVLQHFYPGTEVVVIPQQTATSG